MAAYSVETTATIAAYLQRLAVDGIATVDVADLADHLGTSYKLAKSTLKKACQYLGYRLNGSAVDMRNPLPRIARRRRHRVTALERFHEARRAKSA